MCSRPQVARRRAETETAAAGSDASHGAAGAVACAAFLLFAVRYMPHLASASLKLAQAFLAIDAGLVDTFKPLLKVRVCRRARRLAAATLIDGRVHNRATRMHARAPAHRSCRW